MSNFKIFQNFVCGQCAQMPILGTGYSTSPSCHPLLPNHCVNYWLHLGINTSENGNYYDYMRYKGTTVKQLS